jgi:hypothetical protein
LINDNVDVRVNSSIKSSIVEVGGYENVIYNQKNVRNFLDKEHRLKCREGDGQALQLKILTSTMRWIWTMSYVCGMFFGLMRGVGQHTNPSMM